MSSASFAVGPVIAIKSRMKCLPQMLTVDHDATAEERKYVHLRMLCAAASFHYTREETTTLPAL